VVEGAYIATGLWLRPALWRRHEAPRQTVRQARRPDHHVTNTRFGVLNWVDEAAPSVGEMVFRLLRATGMPVDADVALNLYLSLVEDTGRFSYSNTTPEALRAAADLVAAGARPETVTNHLFRNEDLGPCACAHAASSASRRRRTGASPRPT
jgi:nanoRNase/pAp phosphatase (c-di-AMP/oligoRNAs hydrolase)